MTPGDLYSKSSNPAVDAATSIAPPPSYTSGPSETKQPRRSRQKPCNFITIHRGHDSITQTFVIDPAIKVAESLLPPLSNDENTRSNLSLQLTSGHIRSDVWLKNSDKRVELFMKSQNGSVSTIILREPESSTPFCLVATAQMGTVWASIPRSFHGPVTVIRLRGTTFGFSDEVQRQLTLISDVGNTYKGFIGDMSEYGETGKKAGLDEMVLTSDNTSGVEFWVPYEVKVVYNDEPPVQPKSQCRIM